VRNSFRQAATRRAAVACAALLLGASAVSGCGVAVQEASESIEEANLKLEQMDRPKQVDLSPFLDPALPEYRIGPGDRVTVDVAGFAELSRRGLLVRPDGRISLFLLEDVDVTGRTPTEIARALEGAYDEFIKEPKILVTVDEVRSSRYMVLGAVASPGIYPLEGPTTLIEALAQSGGFARGGENGRLIADVARSYLVRGSSVVPIQMAQLAAGDPSQNVYIHPGDLIYIPARFTGEVAVLGEVQSPAVVPHDGTLTLMKALGEAGWVTIDAKESTVRVIRGSLVDPQVYLVDAEDIAAGKARDVKLMPGDIVYVTSTEIADWNRVIQQILPTLQAALAARFLVEGALLFFPE
jgi:polysaccharide export outer membrane protein